MARELMAITGLTAQTLVDLARAAVSALGRRPAYSSCAAVAEAVMGHDAWETYKNSKYKSMKGPRAPQGSVATLKRVTIRNKKHGGGMANWTLQPEPEPFAGQDTRWTMDDTFTWMPPDGDERAPHIETLGEMISEAFHHHWIAVKGKAKREKDKDAKKTVKMTKMAATAKMTSTATEVSQWDGPNSVN